jgi:hypothetical protein
MATYQTLTGKLFRGDTYIENPQFVDYGDGAGLQISGGNVFKLDGTPVGHCDQPGPRGVQGVTGNSSKNIKRRKNNGRPY